MSEKNIQIVSKLNGVGLNQDVEIVSRILRSAGYKVTVSEQKRWLSLPLSFMAFINNHCQIYDANIFMERVHSKWRWTAKKNIVIPNQERFPKRLLNTLNQMDAVFVKTRHAREVFSHCTDNINFVGFTSNDMYDPGVRKLSNSFLHLAGKSALKGTETILSIWRRNSDWPTLTLIQQKGVEDELPENVNLIDKPISRDELKVLLNRHPFHLCTSRAEGWGHYIVEAASCCALIVTTDGEPMNEIVSAEFGVLVPWYKQTERHLGKEFIVDEEQLEAALSKLVRANREDTVQAGNNARSWYLENNAQFERRLIENLQQYLF